MVSNEDLKKIVILEYFDDEMRKKLIPVIDVLTFDEQEQVFSEGDEANRFYMLRRGKILLEKRISDKITVSLGAIKPGYAFGWSAMLDAGSSYTCDAVCATPCEIFSMRSKQMKKMFEKDYQMGYIFTQRLLRTMKSRLDHRTTQFLRAIQNHPEIQSLIEG